MREQKGSCLRWGRDVAYPGRSEWTRGSARLVRLRGLGGGAFFEAERFEELSVDRGRAEWLGYVVVRTGKAPNWAIDRSAGCS